MVSSSVRGPIGLNVVQEHPVSWWCAAAPAQRHLGAAFSPLEIQDYFFQQRAQQFFAIPIGGSWCGPHLANIEAEHTESLSVALG